MTCTSSRFDRLAGILAELSTCFDLAAEKTKALD